MVTFECLSCHNSVGPFKQSEGAEIRPESCDNCQRSNTFKINQVSHRTQPPHSSPPLFVATEPLAEPPLTPPLSGSRQAKTVYCNYQKITLQESPGTVPAGRVPRYKEVILTADLIDRARPGEEIEVTGIYKYRAEGSLNQKNGFPVFSTCIEANYIHKREDLFSMYHITDDDKINIHRLASNPKIADLLIGYGRSKPSDDTTASRTTP